MPCCSWRSSRRPRRRKRAKRAKNGPTSYGGKTLSDWRRELASPDASRRADAIVAVTHFGDASAECVKDLLTIVNGDRDVSPRVKALLALRHVAIDAKEVSKVITAVTGRLSTRHESQAIVRLEAIITLRRWVEDPAMSNAVSALILATQDRSSWEIRHASIAVLWRVGRAQKDGADAAIYEALMAVLQADRTHQVRLETLQGLGALGRPTSGSLLAKLVTTLNSAAHSENKALAIWAYSALVAMQDGKAAETSLGAIAKFLRNEQLELRIQAATALGALNTMAKSRVPMLLTTLKDPEADAVWAAAVALGGIGDDNEKVVDALLELLANKEPMRAAAAVSALVTLRVNSSRVTNAFDKMLKDPDLDLRVRALIDGGLKEWKKPKK